MFFSVIGTIQIRDDDDDDREYDDLNSRIFCVMNKNANYSNFMHLATRNTIKNTLISLLCCMCISQLMPIINHILHIIFQQNTKPCTCTRAHGSNAGKVAGTIYGVCTSSEMVWQKGRDYGLYTKTLGRSWSKVKV